MVEQDFYLLYISQKNSTLNEFFDIHSEYCSLYSGRLTMNLFRMAY